MTKFFDRATNEELTLEVTRTPRLTPAYDVAWFLPSYPAIAAEDFTKEIITKKELWDAEDPHFLKHQARIARFMRDYTIYDSLLLCHDPGTGKSSVAIAVMDALKRSVSAFRSGRVVVVANNSTIVNNFKEQIRIHSGVVRDMVVRLTENIQDPERRAQRQQEIWPTAMTRCGIEFYTYYQLSKRIQEDTTLVSAFSDALFIMDECHHLRFAKHNTNKEKIYWDIHTLLHQIHRKKVLLLTGTPMQDQPEEIALLWNLMLPLDQQLPTGAAFIKEFFEVDREIRVALLESGEEQQQQQQQGTEQKVLVTYRWNPTTHDRLASVLSGHLSYVRQHLSAVTIRYQGEVTPPMTALPLVRDTMGPFQTQHFSDAVQIDAGRDGRRISSYDNAVQASLFVFPDGSWGSKGFQRFVRFHSFSRRDREAEGAELMTRATGADPFELQWISDPSEPLVNRYPDMTDAIRRAAVTPIHDKIQFLSQFSCTYASFLRSFMDPSNLLKKAYVYSYLVEGSGVLLLALLLRDLFGMEMITRASPALKTMKSTRDRFILINDVVHTPDRDVQELLRFFNQEDNKTGRLCRLVLSTNKTTEGISLMHIRQVHILTPKWNFAEITQAIARGLRQGSHKGLQDPSVAIFLHYAVPNLGPTEEDQQLALDISIDFQRYINSETKDRNIALVQRFMMTSAWDCVYEYPRHTTGMENRVSGSRECNYGECAYSCWPWDRDPPSTPAAGEVITTLDASNAVVWYDVPLYKSVTERLQEYFRRHTHCTQDALYEHLAQGHRIRMSDTSGESDAQDGPLSLSPFEFLVLVSRWIEEKVPLYNIYGKPVLLHYTEPYYFISGYIPGTSGIPMENTCLEIYAREPLEVSTDATAEEIIQEDWSQRNDNMTRVYETLHALALRRSTKTSDTESTILVERIDDILKVVSFQDPRLPPRLLETYGSMFSKQLGGGGGGMDPRTLALALLVDRFRVVFPDQVNATSLEGAWWNRVKDASGLDLSHQFSTTRRRMGEDSAWVDNIHSVAAAAGTTASPPTAVAAPAPRFSKPLPSEEMSPEEQSRWIFDNPVGFYFFAKNGIMYIRDVRNKALFRLKDRKKIPVGKACALFRKGELLSIGLQALRLVSPEAAEALLNAARTEDLLLPPETPRDTIEAMLRPYADNLAVLTTHLQQPLDTMTTMDLRFLLAMQGLKICASKKAGNEGDPTMCDFLTDLYRSLELVKE